MVIIVKIALALYILALCWKETFGQDAQPGTGVHQSAEKVSSAESLPVPEFSYLGCFEDNRTQSVVLTERVTSSSAAGDTTRPTSFQEPTPCVSECWKNGFAYSGIQNYRYCWCGADISQDAQQGRCMSCLGKFKYRCGGSTSIAVYKTSQIPPTATICQSNRTSLAGSEVIFQCLVKGDEPVTISWSRSGLTKEELLANPRIRISSSTLTISEVQKSDEGEYMCEARNSFISVGGQQISSAMAMLRVQTPPTAEISMLSPFESGQTARLACLTTGDRPTDLRWLKDNATLPTPGRWHRMGVQTWEHNGSSVLTISNVSHLLDTGTYTCTARNDAIIDISQRQHSASYLINVANNMHWPVTSQPITMATTKPSKITETIRTSSPTKTTEQSPETSKTTSKGVVIILAILGILCLFLFIVVIAFFVCLKRQRAKIVATENMLNDIRFQQPPYIGRSSYIYEGEGGDVIILNSDKSASMLSIHTNDLPYPFNLPRRLPSNASHISEETGDADCGQPPVSYLDIGGISDNNERRISSSLV